MIFYLTISHCCQKGHESQKSQRREFALEKHITIIPNYVPSLPLLHHCTILTVTTWNARFDERLRNSYYSGVPSKMITNQPINLRVTHHPSDSHHSINSYLNWPNSPFSPALRFQSYTFMSYVIWENWLLTRIKAMWFSWSMVNKNLWCMREICKIASRMVWLVGHTYIQPLICPDLIYNVKLVTGSTMLAAWVNCRLWWNWWLLLMSLLGTIPQQGCHQTIKVAARWQRRSVFLPLSSTPHPPTRHPFAHPTPRSPISVLSFSPQAVGFDFWHLPVAETNFRRRNTS